VVNVIINVSVPVSPPVSKDRASIVWGPTSVTEPLMLAMVEPRAFIVAPVTVAEIPSMYHSSAASRVASLSLSSVTVALKTKVGFRRSSRPWDPSRSLLAQCLLRECSHPLRRCRSHHRCR